MRKAQINSVGLEIVLRSCLYAVATIAVVHGVQVHHKQLVFAVLLFQIHGQLRLAHLAFDRYLVGLLREHRVAHKLLRDGGCAFQAATCKVVDECARNARKVNPSMLVEAHVLGVHRGLFHEVADLV